MEKATGTIYWTTTQITAGVLVPEALMDQHFCTELISINPLISPINSTLYCETKHISYSSIITTLTSLLLATNTKNVPLYFD